MKRTSEELNELGIVNPEFEKAVRCNPMPVFTGDLISCREQRARHLQQLRHSYPIPGPLQEVAERSSTILARDGYEIPVKIYVPKKSPKDGCPLIVMYHEGGWCLGDLTDEEQNCRMFCRDVGAVCVNVDYRLAPEHPFPAGVNDAWDVLKWVATNASSIGADPSRGFIIGGSSAGGNLTAVVAHLARDENLLPPLTGQYLSVPALLPDQTVPKKYQPEYLSFSDNASDPVLRKFNMDDVVAVLQCDINSPLFAPFNHPSGHYNLPPAYFQICGMDPLRDDGLIYERVLREEYGVATRLDLYAGYGHMFWTNWPELPMSRKFVADTLNGIKWLLSVSGSRDRNLR